MSFDELREKNKYDNYSNEFNETQNKELKEIMDKLIGDKSEKNKKINNDMQDYIKTITNDSFKKKWHLLNDDQKFVKLEEYLKTKLDKKLYIKYLTICKNLLKEKKFNNKLVDYNLDDITIRCFDYTKLDKN